jgi:hypothetical protein
MSDLLTSGGSWRAGLRQNVLIVNTRVVTLDVRHAALSGQSVRLVHENIGRGMGKIASWFPGLSVRDSDSRWQTRE